jgi:hypothetical protein
LVISKHCRSIFFFFFVHDRVPHALYEGVSRSFRTGRLERELQMV